MGLQVKNTKCPFISFKPSRLSSTTPNTVKLQHRRDKKSEFQQLDLVSANDYGDRIKGRKHFLYGESLSKCRILSRLWKHDHSDGGGEHDSVCCVALD